MKASLREPHLRMSPRGFALRIAGFYCLLGMGWIVVTDWALGDLGWYGTLPQTLKGLLFVAVSAGAIHFLVLRDAAALQRLERTLDSVIQSCGIGVWDYDAEREEVTVLPSEYRLLGYTAATVPREVAPFSMVHPDDREAARQNWHEALQDPVRATYLDRMRIRKLDGHFLWIESRGLIERAPDGRPLRATGVHIDITAQRAREDELALARWRHDELSGILRRSPAIALSWRAEEGWPLDYLSPGIAALGYGPDNGRAALELRELLHPADRPQFVRLMAAAAGEAAQEQRVEIECRLRHADGHHLWFRLDVWKRPRPGDGATRFEAVAVDIGRHKEVQARHDLLLAAVNAMGTGLTIAEVADDEERLVYANDGFLRMTGFSREEILDRSCRFLQRDDRQQPGLALVRQALDERKSVKALLRNYRKDGSMFWNELTLSPVGAHDLHQRHFVGIQADATGRVMLEESLRRTVSSDALTGVLNRVGFVAAVTEMLRAGSVLVAICDVRRMQSLNDTRGSDIGDAVLKSLAQRAASVAGEGGAVGRVGGDKIAIALAGLAEPQPAEAPGGAFPAAVQAYWERLHEPQTLPGLRLNQSFCLGWAEDRLPSGAELVAHAEIALYEAKRIGFNVVRRFEPAMAERSAARQQMADALRDAVERGDFELHYQPKVRLSDGGLAGAECLLRWRHAAFGLQPPATFIPVAEESGLIVEIGEWVLHEAAAFIRQMRDRGVFCPPLAVNISPVQFRGSDLYGAVRGAMERHGLAPDCLILEITESVLAEREFTDTVLRRLRADGFRISVDDFGTGYSSLEYLRTYPIDEIKIDRSYVQGIAHDPYSRCVVEMARGLAKLRGCTVTAEGVEHEEERAVVASLGCDQGQGYLFSRPLVAEAFADLLAKDQG